MPTLRLIAQVSGTYGRGSAETIVENCGNILILVPVRASMGAFRRIDARLWGLASRAAEAKLTTAGTMKG